MKSLPWLSVDGIQFEVAEFGECEAKHIAAVHIPEMKALLAADLVYNQANSKSYRRSTQSADRAT